ncbi:MAG: tripartite tricarboxylate transporter permease, partial [Desulfobacterales bacterium]|nr:tripartite tricarboxylate transporter permease [Desulfobacterales bacterium]
MLEQLFVGMQLMLTWQNILFALVGVGVGIFVGSIPGLTVTMAIAIMVPITFKMSPIPAIAMLLGVYKGGMFGGSLSAILINTPGTPAASATAMDGYPMARKGLGLKAMKVSKYSSVIADTVTDMVLIFVAPPLAMMALKFGPAEIFALVVFSLTIIAVVSGASLTRGLLAAAAGLLFSTVGMDPVTGYSRFSFGHVDVLKGIGL